MKKCSICDQEFIQPSWGKGNNAMPVNDGYCCDSCDVLVVTPCRAAVRGIVRERLEKLDYLQDTHIKTTDNG